MGEKEKPGSASAEIGKYLDILAKDPNSRVFAPLAESYRKAGLLDDAIETALEGLKVHPNYLGGRVALGRAYFEKRQYAEASAEMQKVVKAAPDNLMAHKVLGQIAYGQNDLAAAEKAFKMVLLLDPRDQEAQQLIASIGGGAPPSPPAERSAPEPARPAAPQPSPQPAGAFAGDARSGGEFRMPEELPPPVAAPSAMIPEDLTIEDISLESPIPDFGMLEPPALPEPGLPGPEINFSEDELEPPPPPALQAQPLRLEPEMGWDLEPAAAPAPAAMELEVFAREPWGKAPLREPAAPAPPIPAPAAAAETPVESPFEVFGRAKPGGAPQSAKGEQLAYAEIELEPTAHVPAEAEPAEAGESPFEVFTREPRGGGAAGTASRAGRNEGATFRELEIETTAYTPEAPGENDFREEPVLSLEEELPRIDLAGEVGLGQREEPFALEEGLPPASEPEPEQAPDIEPWAGEPVFSEPEPGEMPVPGETESEAGIEEELPHVGLAREVEPDFGEIETSAREPAPEEDRSPARGVFDTETLAAIYINQGFYGRAAEIYQRLLGDRAGDPGLLQKLAEVRALEQMEQGKGAAIAAPVETPAAAQGGEEGAAGERVRRLQTLLEAFKGGRPQ